MLPIVLSCDIHLLHCVLARSVSRRGNVHSLQWGFTVVIPYGHCGPPHGQESWRGGGPWQ